ncbi:MAG: DNA polymerase III subunit gamma/tau [Defluviitaleaceae bacterium]|nr:DNA polymerase III subunit gamma/tau [Defluviitaleaceae bacterium]
MSSLYRKYRPNNFSQVFGQNHIVKTITNQIQMGKINHAYLFCGTRGTGKTSVARLFARAVNCESSEKPCNICEFCKAILTNNSMNVIEIDAASNNGVDNIREILEEVKYTPAFGIYKIYIIDEVHMLSIGAFNALLKTLEEPPNHVIFILATTDPHKVPATIHSRCQRFEFRRISVNQLQDNLKNIAKLENVQISNEALSLIATLGDGSVRDSLSILGQAFSFYQGDEITLEMVRDLVGSVDTTILFSTSFAIIEKNSIKLIEIIDHISKLGKDYFQFTTEIINHFRNLLLSKILHTPDSILDIDENTFEKLKEQSHRISIIEIEKILDELISLNQKMRIEKNPKILLEIAFIKLCTYVNFNVDIEVQKENKVESKKITYTNDIKDIKIENKNETEKWDNFIEMQSPLLKASLKKCSFKKEDNTIYILAKDEVLEQTLKQRYEDLKSKLTDFFKTDVILKIEYENQVNKVSEPLTLEQIEDLKQKINFDIKII